MVATQRFLDVHPENWEDEPILTSLFLRLVSFIFFPRHPAIFSDNDWGV